MNRSPAPANSLLNTVRMNVNTMNNRANLALNKVANTVTNTVSNTMNTVSDVASSPSISRGIIVILLVGILLIVGFFYKQIGYGIVAIWDRVMTLFGLGKQPEVSPPVTAPPPDSAAASGAGVDHGASREFVDKILPGRAEVFNVSQNKYTYSDAEPLCKALGAELATYEQVKSAFDQGADWCNYGWVKGQMAVYPTQQSTWEQIQNGPEEQRNACGKPGINGGYFDNPDLQFGVNCYGVKPGQKEHDASSVAAGEGQPLTPGALDFEAKVAKYRGQANSIALLPFSKKSWGS